MNAHRISRRHFLQSTAAGAAMAVATRTAAEEADFSGRIKKAVKYHMIQEDLSVEDKLRMIKDVGFDGVEPRSSFHGRQDFDPRELAKASDKVGVPVHGIVNSSNTDLRAAIDEAKMYGATSVLTTIPRMPTQDYLQNYRETQKLLRRAADYAEQQQVHILIENVWASFLIEPLTMRRYIDEIGSPMVQVYFDIGNVVRWGWPQTWIEVLGERIVKLDVKEYDLDVAMNQGMRKAFDVPIGDGSIAWDQVRSALDRLNYRGWATAEVRGGPRQRIAEIAQQMDKVLHL